MITVTLAKQWTDAQGVVHPAGTQVEIAEEQLDDLVAGGYVEMNGESGGDAVRFN
ncbi:MAG TPA: hypothetical protein VGR21_10535 [Cryptosporangiaceae bacterium]|nr:hypothetical protein [Cryptosporangiaceae bacterium]